MRRRHRQSAQLTFVMEFPVGEPCSSSTSGSLWSQIHNIRSSPSQQHPPSHPHGLNTILTAAATATQVANNNGLSLAAATGQQVNGSPSTRIMIVCRHWFLSMTSHCTKCLPRQQRVYGLSPQDPRFTGANAPNTTTTTSFQDQQQSGDKNARRSGKDGVSAQAGDVTTAAGGGSAVHRRSDLNRRQQHQEYRFSGASAPIPPGYEHQHASSNSDSPPYLPSREQYHQAGMPQVWNSHAIAYNQQQDRAV